MSEQYTLENNISEGGKTEHKEQEHCDSMFNMLKFYIPLVIQAASQSLTYPLVASIVSHGKFGPLELSAFAMGQSLMFFLGSIGGGLITTGMVFARTKTGMNEFSKLVNILAAASAVMQFSVCVPPLDDLVFSKVLNLDGDLAHIAKRSLICCVPAQMAFFIRNKYLVSLYNEKKSGLANTATMIRIAATACMSPVFVKLGLTGYAYGSLALTLPVIAESLLSAWFAKPFLEKLTDRPEDEQAPLKKQFYFNLPLSFGGMLLSMSAFLIGVYISRPADKELAMKVHYVIMGVVNPVSFAALRMQSVVIAFPPVNDAMKKKLYKFTIAAGAILAIFPLLAKIGSVADWYFSKVQNLDPTAAAAAAKCMIIVAVLPFIQALRGHAEGLAAIKRRPNAILAGQAVYLATMLCALQIFLHFTIVPGYMMGAVSIIIATFMTYFTVKIGLVWTEFEDKYGDENMHRRYGSSQVGGGIIK